ncbi:L-seryl-tRNA(Sec) selenium transferase [Blastopirellula sp. JC732]|uniref:L-seryl-tRNA(Sec) selenium transferase n=1 Tax=Blastopirellula sediminis TaxID=2894196 RepID=A0A9X1MT18_9BACT|nr:L-seryl-tRNA(Sec) selenium transferase [Blastopirellula sediminis]MCC9604734.1 L-seryl-tRNA(Sec) selenium transferase [Blastopirellula sediminis]MCC9631967.1 L-seryl-tRNA(Sec) selenium transferase [Blastopirellula sediminis]
MPTNLFGKLPTVSELLDKPPLKKLRETMNPATLVSNVGVYLDRYQRDFKSRVADFPAPKLQHLAESISRWLTGDAPAGIRAAINGTGVVLAPELGKCAIAERAIQGAYARLRDYHTTQLDAESSRQSASQAEAVRLITDLAVATDAAIVNTRTAALHLALSELAAGRKVVVARGELGETFDGIHLPNLLAGAGVLLVEVGASNSATLADYEKAIEDDTAAILSIDASNFAGVTSATRPSLAELSALAKKRGVTLIHDVGVGGLQSRDEYQGFGVDSVQAAIAHGADLVIAAGNHLLGGPDAGLLVGRQKLIEQIRSSALFPLVGSSPLELAALTETLEIYRMGELVADEIPLLALLTTTIANLELRANRLAEQILASPLVESVVVEPCKAHLLPGSMPIDSVCVKVVPSDGDVAAMYARLQQNLYPLFVRQAAGHLAIDLRTVFPRQDFLIAGMFPLGVEESPK